MIPEDDDKYYLPAPGRTRGWLTSPDSVGYNLFKSAQEPP